jgi:O-antigen/teichoic acid export membrane protein
LEKRISNPAPMCFSEHRRSLQHVENIRTAMRHVNLLVGCYLGLSVLTLAAIVMLRADPAVVTAAVWVRGTIVVASAALLAVFSARAARGSRGAYLRLRIASTLMLVAIVVIIAVPEDFPLWLKVEQGVCGVFLAGVVLIANGARVRSEFAVRA